VKSAQRELRPAYFLNAHLNQTTIPDRCILWMQVFMRISNLLKALKSPEHRLALVLAMAADAIQIFALPLFCGRGVLASGRPAGLSYGVGSYPVGGMALGFPPYAGGGVDSRSRLISHLDGVCFVRNASKCSCRRARDSPSRSRSGAPAPLASAGYSFGLRPQ
jgi:hypothetical protein